MESLTGTLPSGWVQVRLGDVCDILAGPSGARLRIEKRTSANVPVVAPQDFRNNTISDGDGAVSATLARALSRYRIQPDDVICARTGTLGRQALTGERQDGWLLGTGCLRVRANDQVNPHYLIYYLGHPNVHAWITRSGTASTIPSLSTKTLSTLPVVVPPARIQWKIAEILSALDQKIAIHEQIAATTTALRDTVIPLLLTGSSGDITID